MILRIDGALKPYYAQTLCMTFFPGVKFPQDEVPTFGTPIADFTVRDTETSASASVTLEFDGKKESAEAVCRLADCVDRTRARQLAAGQAFYQAASRLMEFSPPWGIMTGVRPAKIASELFRNHKTPEEAAHWICEKYLTTQGKAKLAVSVAEAEGKLIRPELTRRCSVYIAIPFCPSRCSYCSFVSYTSPKLLSLIPEYLHALRQNIHTVFSAIRRLQIPVSTIYIGGGTPTVLTAEQLGFLLESIAGETDVSSLEEFTLEAGRPDTITLEKMQMASAWGVNRVSVNTQTLNEDVLRAIGRNHTAEQFFAAYEIARKAGIPNINVDLIAGLPGESAGSFTDSLRQIVPLRPENITVHTFSVKKAAEIRWDIRGVYDGKGLAAAESVENARCILLENGYSPYYMYRQKNTIGNLENVGYALSGKEGLYNVYMMEEVHSIFAAGASAVTKFVSPMDADGNNRIERIFEAKYPYEYLKDYEESGASIRAEQYMAAVESFYRQHF